MQTQGSLQESSLASLLQTMQTERATGALALESESETAALYFLFGHLFHASGPGGQGEDVVIGALSWHDGSFRFDPRAKLPPEETIKSSPSELIAEAERRAPAPAEAGGETPAVWPDAGYQEAEAEVPEAPTYQEPVTSGYSQTGWTAPEPEPEPAEAGQPGPGYAEAPAYAAWSPPAAEPAPLAAAYDAPAQYQPMEQSPMVQAAYNREPMASATTPTAPETLLGAPGAAPLDIVYPLPSGRTQYEGLKSAFVDFPKLLRTLRGDQHTGYVRLNSPDFSGVLLFHEGHLLEALSSTPGAPSGEAAFQAVRRSMEAGTGTLDVIDLSGDTVDALAQLLTAPLLFTGLLGRFINFDALLAYLNEASVEGAVLAVGGDDVGIILLSQGQVLGAYTRSNPALSTATTGVAKIAAEKTARIEVKSGAGAVAAIDVDSALSRPY